MLHITWAHIKFSYLRITLIFNSNEQTAKLHTPQNDQSSSEVTMQLNVIPTFHPVNGIKLLQLYTNLLDRYRYASIPYIIAAPTTVIVCINQRIPVSKNLMSIITAAITEINVRIVKMRKKFLLSSRSFLMDSVMDCTHII